MNVFRQMFSRKWILTTLLAVAACAVMIRLGIWQLDRLAQRRAFNARVLSQEEAPPLDLDAQALGLDLYNMEYRDVVVRGTYDDAQAVVLRNQVLDSRPGYRLLVPLHIQGTDAAVIVDRGFVPAEDYDPEKPGAYRTDGPVEVHGIIRRPQTKPDFGGRPDPTPQPGEQLRVWNLANVEQMAAQIPYDLLPVYVQETLPEEGGLPAGTYPYPMAAKPELTEGPHMGYAMQWFLFAAVLATGYPFFIRKETQNAGSKEE